MNKNWGSENKHVKYHVVSYTKPSYLELKNGLTQVNQKVQDELHVDFVGIHVLNGMVGATTVAFQATAAVPAPPRASGNKFLQQNGSLCDMGGGDPF